MKYSNRGEGVQCMVMLWWSLWKRNWANAVHGVRVYAHCAAASAKVALLGANGLQNSPTIQPVSQQTFPPIQFERNANDDDNDDDDVGNAGEQLYGVWRREVNR